MQCSPASGEPAAQLTSSDQIPEVFPGERVRSMILSQRLSAAASLVSKGNRLADIGTDHGFVPVALVETGWIPSAIAMDVKPGPLARASRHIRQHALEDRIQTRLSDGLEALGMGEADTILIAGMGGALTVRILSQRKDLCYEVKELVLQPQSEISDVRDYLGQNGWSITQEKIVLEDGKYYPMMRCIPGEMALTKTQAQYGPCLMRDRPQAWVSYLTWRQSILEKNLISLAYAKGERGRKRREETRRQIEELQELRRGIKF